MMVFLKECFEKVDFEKNQQTTKKEAKLPSRQIMKVNVDPAQTAFRFEYLLLISISLNNSYFQIVVFG